MNYLHIPRVKLKKSLVEYKEDISNTIRGLNLCDGNYYCDERKMWMYGVHSYLNHVLETKYPELCDRPRIGSSPWKRYCQWCLKRSCTCSDDLNTCLTAAELCKRGLLARIDKILIKLDTYTEFNPFAHLPLNLHQSCCIATIDGDITATGIGPPDPTHSNHYRLPIGISEFIPNNEELYFRDIFGASVDEFFDIVKCVLWSESHRYPVQDIWIPTVGSRVPSIVGVLRTLFGCHFAQETGKYWYHFKAVRWFHFDSKAKFAYRHGNGRIALRTGNVPSDYEPDQLNGHDVGDMTAAEELRLAQFIVWRIVAAL